MQRESITCATQLTIQYTFMIFEYCLLNYAILLDFMTKEKDIFFVAVQWQHGCAMLHVFTHNQVKVLI